MPRHPLLFPRTGELVLGDHDRSRMADQVVVVDIATGDELARADTGSPLQSVVFHAAGFDRDAYLCSMATSRASVQSGTSGRWTPRRLATGLSLRQALRVSGGQHLLDAGVQHGSIALGGEHDSCADRVRRGGGVRLRVERRADRPLQGRATGSELGAPGAGAADRQRRAGRRRALGGVVIAKDIGSSGGSRFGGMIETAPVRPHRPRQHPGDLRGRRPRRHAPGAGRRGPRDAARRRRQPPRHGGHATATRSCASARGWPSTAHALLPRHQDRRARAATRPAPSSSARSSACGSTRSTSSSSTTSSSPRSGRSPTAPAARSRRWRRHATRASCGTSA